MSWGLVNGISFEYYFFLPFFFLSFFFFFFLSFFLSFFFAIFASLRFHRYEVDMVSELYISGIVLVNDHLLRFGNLDNKITSPEGILQLLVHYSFIN